MCRLHLRTFFRHDVHDQGYVNANDGSFWMAFEDFVNHYRCVQPNGKRPCRVSLGTVKMVARRACRGKFVDFSMTAGIVFSLILSGEAKPQAIGTFVAVNGSLLLLTASIL